MTDTPTETHNEEIQAAIRSAQADLARITKTLDDNLEEITNLERENIQYAIIRNAEAAKIDCLQKVL